MKALPTRAYPSGTDVEAVAMIEVSGRIKERLAGSISIRSFVKKGMPSKAS